MESKVKLVSVCVVSYNAQDTIIETLESIKNQDYKSIELIISDDCSTDATVKISKNWINLNKDRFVNTELLTASVNQGVCDNCNKIHQRANGDWIKCIAADDILLPCCISSFIQYAEDHSDASFISSYMSWYNETFDEKNCIEREKKCFNDRTIFDASIDKQLVQMAIRPFIYAPPSFYTKKLFIEVGGFDKKYSFEDLPFWINVLEHGYKIHFLPKSTVGYRYHQSSSHLSSKLFNYTFTQKAIPVYRDKCFKYYSKTKIVCVQAEWFLEKVLHFLHMDTANKLNTFIYKTILSVLRRISNYSINIK